MLLSRFLKKIAGLFFLLVVGFQISPAMSGEYDCRKRLMYDYCQGVMLNLAARLSNQEGGPALFEQAMERFRSDWDAVGYSRLPEQPATGEMTGFGIKEGTQEIALICLGASPSAEEGITQIAVRADALCAVN